MRTCASCVHFLPPAASAYDIGVCKRYPPTVVAGGQAVPQISARDWCGEHRPSDTPALDLAASGAAHQLQRSTRKRRAKA